MVIVIVLVTEIVTIVIVTRSIIYGLNIEILCPYIYFFIDPFLFTSNTLKINYMFIHSPKLLTIDPDIQGPIEYTKRLIYFQYNRIRQLRKL